MDFADIDKEKWPNIDIDKDKWQNIGIDSELGYPHIDARLMDTFIYLTGVITNKSCIITLIAFQTQCEEQDFAISQFINVASILKGHR